MSSIGEWATVVLWSLLFLHSKNWYMGAEIENSFWRLSHWVQKWVHWLWDVGTDRYMAKNELCAFAYWAWPKLLLKFKYCDVVTHCGGSSPSWVSLFFCMRVWGWSISHMRIVYVMKLVYTCHMRMVWSIYVTSEDGMVYIYDEECLYVMRRVYVTWDLYKSYEVECMSICHNDGLYMSHANISFLVIIAHNLDLIIMAKWSVFLDPVTYIHIYIYMWPYLRKSFSEQYYWKWDISDNRW